MLERDSGVHMVKEKLCDSFIQWVSVNTWPCLGDVLEPHPCQAPSLRGLDVNQRTPVGVLSPL